MSQGTTIYIKATELAIVKQVGPYRDAVPHAWDELFAWLDQGGHSAPQGRGYEFAYDDTQNAPESNRRYAVAVEVPSTWGPRDQNLISKEYFDGGTYKVFRHCGPYSYLPDKLTTLLNAWDGKNRLVLDHHRPILTLHHNDLNVVPAEDHVADICLPIFAERRAKPRS